jgi:hypothetical protein
VVTGVSHSYGTLDSLPDGGAAQRIFGYVESRLDEFASVISDGSRSNEKSLTDRFVRVLEQTPPEFPFRFHNDNRESESIDTSTDFACYPYVGSANAALGVSALVKFEAKRLSSDLPAKRMDEYVRGRFDGSKYVNCGAIERFKNGRHGRDVNVAGIIGYLQTGDSDQWAASINGWIGEEIAASRSADLTWEEADKLQKVEAKDFIALFTSESKRANNGRPVQFRHLWVNLSLSNSHE